MPDIVWTKDGKELLPHEAHTSYVNGKVTLVIPRISTDHTGKYTCSAKNEGGLATSSAQLVVTGNRVSECCLIYVTIFLCFHFSEKRSTRFYRTINQ